MGALFSNRRRGFTTNLAPTTGSAQLLGNFQTVQGSSPAPTGFDYYIGPNGSDSAAGTSPATAWAITAINTKRATYASKTVGILDGSYNLYTGITSTSGLTQKVPYLQIANGTAALPTIIKAVNARQAIFTTDNGSGGRTSKQTGMIGQSTFGASSSGGFAATGHAIIDGISFTHGYQHAIVIEGVTDVIVRNCSITDFTGSTNDNPGGIWHEDSTDLTITNCYIDGCYGTTATANAGYGVIGFHNENSIVEYCTIKNCDSGIYHKQTGYGSYTIRNNLIICPSDGRENSGIKEATSSSSGKTGTVHHNIIIAKNPWQGRGFTFPGVMSVTCYNNTFYGANFDTGGVFIPLGAGKLNFYNNIIQRTGTVNYEGDVTFCVTSPNTLNYNCYPLQSVSTATLGLSSLADPGSPTLRTFANFKTQTGKDTASIAALALFVNAGGTTDDDYVLQAGSPCKNTGRSDGTSGGSVVDMGAWGNSPPSIIGADF